jgi:hypothetical protein
MNTHINWIPIEEFDKDAMHRIPVLLCAPDFLHGTQTKASIATGLLG